MSAGGATAPGKGKPGYEGANTEAERIHRIRITLSSRNVANLEKGKKEGRRERRGRVREKTGRAHARDRGKLERALRAGERED